jgi:hypothetical protein
MSIHTNYDGNVIMLVSIFIVPLVRKPLIYIGASILMRKWQEEEQTEEFYSSSEDQTRGRGRGGGEEKLLVRLVGAFD